jgi:hypothetical protein
MQSAYSQSTRLAFERGCGCQRIVSLAVLNHPTIELPRRHRHYWPRLQQLPLWKLQTNKLATKFAEYYSADTIDGFKNIFVVADLTVRGPRADIKARRTPGIFGGLSTL